MRQSLGRYPNLSENFSLDDRQAGPIQQPAKPTEQRGHACGRLVVFGTADLDTAVARSYLLKGLICPDEMSLWVGAPKCGKSFLMLYLAYRLSLGHSVFGRRVNEPASVLYVAAEGEGGIGNRIAALRRQFGDSIEFHFIAQPIDLLHPYGDLTDIESAIATFKAKLVVIDTLSRAMAGGDENGPSDMGTFINNIAAVRHATKAHIAIVHHGTKASNGSNPRGHSSLVGAADAVVEVQKLDRGLRTAPLFTRRTTPTGYTSHSNSIALS